MAGALKMLRALYRLSLTMPWSDCTSSQCQTTNHNTQWNIDPKFELNY